jgi:uncharacterized tellurite resistance protein B-like protein
MFRAGKEHPLRPYPTEEKIAYLSLVAVMAAADGLFASEEREGLQELCYAVGLRETEVSGVIAFAETVEPFSLEETLISLRYSELRFTLMTDVLFMAYADHTVTKEEEQEIVRFSGFLAISSEQVKSLRHYVEAVLAFGAEREKEDSCWDSIGQELRESWGFLGVPAGAVLIAGGLMGGGVAVAAAGLGLGAAGGMAAAFVLGSSKEQWHLLWGRLKTCMR